MGNTKHEVLPGTLNLLILKTLATLWIGILNDLFYGLEL